MPIADPELFELVGELPYDWQIASDTIAWGTNAAKVLEGFDPITLATGQSYDKLIDPQSPQSRDAVVKRSVSRDDGSGVAYQIEYALQRPGDAAVLWVEDTGCWFAGQDGRPVRARGVVRAITARHQHAQRLAYLSRFDPLTGEMNHWHLMDLLESTIEEAIKLRSSCGFMLVAIDNLGHINEAYGYDVADDVIVTIGKRVRSQMRLKDQLGRVAGNKFGLILNNCTPDDMLIASDRLLAAVRNEMVQTRSGPVAVTVTIGGVIAPRYVKTRREAYSRAQQALDNAKSKRRGSFQIYRPDPERDAQRRHNVLATEDIIAALNQRRIFLAFEPVVTAASRQLAFYECLLRAQRPDHSMLTTIDIVPLAERLGLVRLLDHRVLELVLQELATAPALSASLNVSTGSIVDPDWWGALESVLRAQPDLGQRLTVEITETTAIHNLEDARDFITRIKDMGCRIAIDDFGAGFTSFRNLRNLGVDLIKIDGSFVRRLRESQDDRIFVQTIIGLAHRLGLETVAEWVPDEETAAMLVEFGCDYLQGVLLGLASTDRPWLVSPRSAAESA
jgi:diguanylate cyclase (GGDEF)-like protein